MIRLVLGCVVAASAVFSAGFVLWGLFGAADSADIDSARDDILTLLAARPNDLWTFGGIRRVRQDVEPHDLERAFWGLKADGLIAVSPVGHITITSTGRALCG